MRQACNQSKSTLCPGVQGNADGHGRRTAALWLHLFVWAETNILTEYGDKNRCKTVNEMQEEPNFRGNKKGV